MTSIWFPNNKYPPNTKNYLPCFVLGGGFSIRRKGLYILSDIATGILSGIMFGILSDIITNKWIYVYI